MKWAHYTSLRPDARAAFDKGDGKHGKYAVDGKHIALIDQQTGRPKDWVLVLRGGGEPIEEVPAHTSHESVSSRRTSMKNKAQRLLETTKRINEMDGLQPNPSGGSNAVRHDKLQGQDAKDNRVTKNKGGESNGVRINAPDKDKEFNTGDEFNKGTEANGGTEFNRGREFNDQ